MRILSWINDPTMVNLDDLIQVNSVGLDLEDVRVSFNHDVKAKISGIDIEGKQGEILNLPRWIANVLQTENHVQIQDADMVVELKQALVKENVQGEFELSTLEPHFYFKLKSYMKRLSRDDFDKVESMLNSLFRKRQGKIIHLADSSKLTADLAKKLTIEEQHFYNNIYKTSNDFKKKIIGDKK